MTQGYDLIYSEGPGDIVSSHASWRRGGDFQAETSATFSGQLFDFCRREGMSVYAISSHKRAEMVTAQSWVIANVPQWELRIPKLGYWLTEFIHTLRLLSRALRTKPRVILISSGKPGQAMLLRLSGARVVLVLHNTLWPEGYRPRFGLRQRMDGFMWRRFVWWTLVVSPAGARQVKAVAGEVPIKVFTPSFPAKSFAEVPGAKDLRSKPFRVMFCGRVEESKGVFDILEMAEKLPQVEFTICGDGGALPEVRQLIAARHLQNVVTFGKLDRPELVARYIDAHVLVVPTRSTFSEGFAMVVAESLLLLRPVITSPVVPASEVLGSAVRLVRTDDVLSYVEAIQELSTDAAAYHRLVENARALRTSILDDSRSFQAALEFLKEA